MKGVMTKLHVTALVGIEQAEIPTRGRDIVPRRLYIRLTDYERLDSLKAVEVAPGNRIGSDHGPGIARIAGHASRPGSPRLRAMIERREFRSGRTTL